MAKQATETSEAPEKENETPDGPLLDLSDAAVRKMIKNAKRRGYVTYEQLNEVMPSEEVTSEQIEDTLAMLNDMGINVIEAEEATDEEASEEGETADEPEEAEGGELAEAAPRAVARSETKSEPAERTDDPVRMYLRGDGQRRTALARGRNRHRQAHRGGPRGDDRRAVRKPPHLPGHHHLAR